MAEIDAKVDAGESGDAEKVDVGEDGPAEDEAQDLSGAELAFAWITGRVRTAFAFLKPANVRKSFESEPVRSPIEEFIKRKDYRTLFVWPNRKGSIMVSHSRPNLSGMANGRTAMYFIKTDNSDLSAEDGDAPIGSQILVGELTHNLMAHLEGVLQDVFLPLVSNQNNHSNWGEVASKTTSDKLHSFLGTVSITLGHTKGETCLPLPALEPMEGNSNYKDRVHLLESAVIMWTKQIKNMLKMDPENALKRGDHPTPDLELQFWISKARNLNSVFQQLQSDFVRKVLRFLDLSKSTYCTPFAKLCKEVFTARIEANDNVKYLSTLRPWVDKLVGDTGEDFGSLTALFRPIMHLILMIWKNSKCYNTPGRLVVLVREICNALIAQSCKYVSGEEIFRLIDENEAGFAVEKLKTTLKVCGTFKSTYFDYKATANSECAANPWRIQNNALFVRLDTFLERCHDILDLTQTIVQFSQLGEIEVGGTKGKTLTTSVQQIFSDFNTAVAAFENVQYDIMDVNAKRFDDDFYEFRCIIKELERRLGSILIQAFDDSATIYGRFKLLDSFEGLLERPIIQDELEKKHVMLVQQYGVDLKSIQELFLAERDEPPIPINLPPVAGSITWCRGIMQRANTPMQKLQQLHRSVLEREEAKEVTKVHENIYESLNEYVSAKVEKWSHDVEKSSQAKLKLPLLRRDGETGLLAVNFDPDLVALLREVKYFLLLELPVPDSAKEIFKKAEVFRTQTGNLELIVNMYNNMVTSLLPVEKPLVKTYVSKIDKTLSRGVKQLSWKSHGIDLFITECMADVKSADRIMSTLKSNLAKIETIMEDWAEIPLFERSVKPVGPAEFQQAHRQLLHAGFKSIRDKGNSIHKMLRESNKVLKVSQGLPDWKAYVDFVNNVVVGGLVRIAVQALEHCIEQVDPVVIAKKERQPVLEIKLSLVGSQVVYKPQLGVATRGDGLRNIVNKWIDDFMQPGMLVRRLDTSNGSYVKELQSNMHVCALVAATNEILDVNDQKLMAFKADYERFDYLFTKDIASCFAEFLVGATVTDHGADERAGGGAGREPGKEGGAPGSPSAAAAANAGAAADGEKGRPVYDLTKFDEDISNYQAVLTEINKLRSLVDIGWVRVNTQPIKQALSMWVSQWQHTYTNHLVNHVRDSLQQLMDFVGTIRFGLKIEVTARDKDALMKVMGYIRDVRKMMTATKEMMEPLREATVLLKKHGIDMEGIMLTPWTEELLKPGVDLVEREAQAIRAGRGIELLDYLQRASAEWDSVVNETFHKKEEILPYQNAQVDHIKDELDSFSTRVVAFRKEFRRGAPFVFSGAPKDAYVQIDGYEHTLGTLILEVSRLNELEELFELQVVRYPAVNDTASDLRILKQAWDFKSLILCTYEKWKMLHWSSTTVMDIEDLLDENKKLHRSIKEFANKFPIVRTWGSQKEGIYYDIETMVKDVNVILPLISSLKSEAMCERHWRSLSMICHSHTTVNVRSASFCLENLFELHLQSHADDVLGIVETAEKEMKIEKKLNQIENAWAGLSLEYVKHKQSDILTIKVPDTVVEALELHQMELQSMISMGKFVAFFKERVSKWQSTLGNVEATLKEWSSVTKQWASLEAIFLSSADIRAQMPEDTARFEAIDHDFKEMMLAAVEEPSVVEACTADHRFDVLREMSRNLELCQKSLNEYLDVKKTIYPRFYFVASVALLDILSNGNNPPRIMRHFGDCYVGLKSLEFPTTGSADAEGGATVVLDRAVSAIAKDGEILPFEKDFEIKGAVETWLNECTEHMKHQLRLLLDRALGEAVHWSPDRPRHAWLFQYPAQTVLSAVHIVWTEETETALDEHENGNPDAMKAHLKVCTDRLEKLIGLVLGELKKGDRKKIITMITMDVHGRDQVHKLIDERATGPMAFGWQEQMRAYWEPSTRDMDCRICDFRSKYSYEPIGNSGRLVITPLTDRCYITLCTALRLMLSGAPAGPAGTGKTETVKDLAKSLGLPAYVFNCSDQMNFQSLADIFKGLSQTGAWGCFDEFNRISVEVLSIVATQVKSIQEAIQRFAIPANRPKDFQSAPPGCPPQKVGLFDLQGTNISLVPTVGLFITMNPGYAGRTELPQNLSVLFRPCAMIRPDLTLICENMLMAEGFVQAPTLSIKFVTLYGLSSELLSKQPHYDWGLRAVRSVLVVAGILKRKAPKDPEEQVLMRALRDFNMPKIPSWDAPIFYRLIKDLFPVYAEKTPVIANKALRQQAVAVCKKRHLQPDEDLISRVLQLQAVMNVRHSVMLLGPGGCGKTTIQEVLLGCLNFGRQKRVAISEVICPKALTVDELYGYMTLSKDWLDGALSIIMRGMSKNDRDLGYTENQTSKWVVLDGDIDTLWIESMNSVMDDNKVLTLVSNERIPLSDDMHLVFETDSLINASPATVSRAGIIYINEEDIGWRPVVESWLHDCNSKNEHKYIPGLFSKYIDRIQGFARQAEYVVPVRILSQVSTVLAIIRCMLDDIKHEDEKTQEVVEGIFSFACIWAFGGSLAESLHNGNQYFAESWAMEFKPSWLVKDTSIYEYYFDTSSKAFRTWQSTVQPYVPQSIGQGDTDVSFGEVFVDTATVAQMRFLLTTLLSQETPTMLVGLSGTGKSKIMSDFLSLQDEYVVHDTVNMNYYMEHKDLQRRLERSLDKRSGNTYAPPAGKRMIYFIDDMNLPYKEDFGTQNSLSLLRMVMDTQCLFDRSDFGTKKEIVDVNYMGAMNPTAGSFSVADRLQRHFSVFSVQTPKEAEALSIYRQIVVGHLQISGFQNEVAQMGASVVAATIDLQNSVRDKFRPSTSKFMYTWNMRDLAAISRGICFASAENCTTGLDFARLWLHEARRTFSDRMVNQAEIDRFDAVAISFSKKYFSDVCNVEEEMVDEKAAGRPLIFTNFIRSSNGSLPYQGVPSMEKLSKTLEHQLAEYNDGHAVMNLVLFEQAMRHVCRIARILMSPGGHGLLLGVGGSGKQSLTRLSAHISDCDLVQFAISGKFGVPQLKEALQGVITRSGVKDTPTVLMFNDAQIVDDRFLVYINDLLATSWITDLFAEDEMDGIFASLRSSAKIAGVPDTPTAMLAFLISRVRKNLHLMLCFSPNGDWLRLRARRFPAIVSCTTIDQFHPWPRDALVAVASIFLTKVDLGVGGEELRENIAHHMGEVHLSVMSLSERFYEQKKRYNYVTPTSFLELIDFFKTLLARKSGVLVDKIERLRTGLMVLRKTAADVKDLQADLAHTMSMVEEKRKHTDALLDQMGKQRADAEKHMAAAKVQADHAEAANAEANRIEAEASSDLAEAKPAMERANEAVNCLSKASLSELKNFPVPPSGVDIVTKACLMMVLGEMKNHSWERAKKMMANVSSFMASLQNFDAENISDALIAKLQPIVENPVMDYDNMMKKSQAAANLASWVVNIFKYNRIYVKVKPLMDALKGAQIAKAEAEASLAEAQMSVATAQGALAELRASLLEATEEKRRVEKQAEDCQKRLDLAERLTSGLSSEGERWESLTEKLEDSKLTIVGDTLLSSAFVSYISPFDAEFREMIWRDQWIPDLLTKEIPLTEDITPLLALTNETQVAKLVGEGLPSDAGSVENGTIVTNTLRWPLFIDPQLQGLQWLQQRAAVAAEKMAEKQEGGDDAADDGERDTAGEIDDGGYKAQDADIMVIQIGGEGTSWLASLKLAISEGRTLIIENLGSEIDSTIDPVLKRNIVKKGRMNYIELAGEMIEYDSNFNLFLQTKLSNPHYKPEVFAQCTVINFIATESGLEDQLLEKVVNNEKPQLEAEKQDLQKQMNLYKQELVFLEDQLLERLANAPADILSDVALIEGLETTKAKAVEIELAVKKGKETEIAINKAREVFRPAAAEAAMLYFILTRLSAINHMYRYSLSAFTGYFFKAMASAPQPEDITLLEERVDLLGKEIRKTIMLWVARGLKENHKLVFLGQIALQLLARQKLAQDFSMHHLQFLLRPAFAVDMDMEDCPLAWINPMTWAAINSLSELDVFNNFPADLEDAESRFREWYNHVAPETEKLPLDWAQLEKRPFQKLLVVRALRPDRLIPAFRNWINFSLPECRSYIDADDAMSSTQILDITMSDSTPSVPLLFILSAGSDVVSDVDILAAREGLEKGISYHNVAMGQGQDDVAHELLFMGHKQGHWIILNNVHLMPGWMGSLERQLDEFSLDDASHPRFRVFLTAEPSTNVPIGILSRCIKLANEPPSGLKANLKRAFSSFDPNMFDEMDFKSRAIVFGLCHFHSVMMERRKFGAMGFNNSYPFSLGDLRDSTVCLNNYMEANQGGKVPWTDLKYLFGQIIYGGHIVNDFDRITCMTLLDFFMRDALLEDGTELYPFVEGAGVPMGPGSSFTTIAPTTWNKYSLHIENAMGPESPLAYGLHPNAEIDSRTSLSNELVMQLGLLQDTMSQDSESGSSPEIKAETALIEILDRFAERSFDVETIKTELEGLMGPYQNVFMQECDALNALLKEINRTLEELNLGFAGELTMSSVMENLMNSLYRDTVPISWQRLAWPSQRPLGGWLADLNRRLEQLQLWTEHPIDIPRTTWLGGLKNPQSFLTAIKQVAAQEDKLELQKLVIFTDILKKNADEIDAPAKVGALIHGLFLEGARFNTPSSLIETSKPKELYFAMPAVNCRAVTVNRLEAGSAYHCPVYKTRARGAGTFVFSAQLKTKSPPARWVLAGVALVLDVGL
jgi:dynein heavy chain